MDGHFWIMSGQKKRLGASGVPEHVRVGFEAQLGLNPGPLDHAGEASGREWRTAHCAASSSLAWLELVAAVGDLKTHAALQTRVGIATGLVVVGDLIGSGASQEQAIVGETPSLAARLQGVEPTHAAGTYHAALFTFGKYAADSN
jgi:class 3 adenylate cyclase